MKLKEITVSYGATQSLPEYSNIKPSLTLTAAIEPEDDPTAVEFELWAWARDSVHAQIDLALEASGKAAKYSTEPRYQVLRTYWNQWDHRGEEKPPQYVIIAPDELKLDRGAYSQRLIVDSSKLRYAHAQKVASELLGDKDEGYTLLDCANGDLTPLNLALSAPESNPEVAPTEESPF
jgi:hypothetical protein